VHHRVFVHDDMAIRSAAELGFVLIPWYASLGLLAMALPALFVLSWVLSRNVAALFIATAMGYVLLYEVFHLAYHLPADSVIGRLRVIRILRQHHAAHHRPSLMRSWNFNVILPLWDQVMGTRWHDRVAR
jgi:sterol desaturase/sphingolipid hydroxylase (fatty acid hydroxylase superfamily)